MTEVAESSEIFAHLPDYTGTHHRRQCSSCSVLILLDHQRLLFTFSSTRSLRGFRKTMQTWCKARFIGNAIQTAEHVKKYINILF
jgi:hypothetical protein